jgi:hypothetical protein
LDAYQEAEDAKEDGDKAGNPPKPKKAGKAYLTVIERWKKQVLVNGLTRFQAFSVWECDEYMQEAAD